MKIKKFQVTGLMGRPQSINLQFHDDINIITGYNGSGKTTVLKLLWYLLSGNIHIALKEIRFQKCKITTDTYSLSIAKLGDSTCEAEIHHDEKVRFLKDVVDSEDDLIFDARDGVKDFTQNMGSSIFFPTFRRIEGGFGIETVETSPSRSVWTLTAVNEVGNLQKSVSAVSRRLSNGKHTFITSIATNDISELIQSNYTELSEQANTMQKEVNESVVLEIQNYRSRGDSNTTPNASEKKAAELLDEVRQRIEQANERRAEIMQPLSAVQQLVTKIFRHKGIRISGRVNFGDAAEAIASDKLSAGEKQMLSFICYNALTTNSIIFIDEPELSLHVDWQRTLFPTLVGQSKNNQFIIATHSPFIYSKYPDKELMLSNLRGDESDEEA